MDVEIEHFRGAVTQILGVDAQPWRIGAIVNEARAALERAYAQGRAAGVTEIVTAPEALRSLWTDARGGQKPE